MSDAEKLAEALRSIESVVMSAIARHEDPDYQGLENPIDLVEVLGDIGVAASYAVAEYEDDDDEMKN